MLSKVYIKREIVNLICEYSKNAYPREFGAMLRIRNNVICDLLFYPKSVNGNDFISIYDWEIPIGLDYDGTVHSHPSSSSFPSREDLMFFETHKRVHLIVSFPFEEKDISAYTKDGKKLELEIID